MLHQGQMTCCLNRRQVPASFNVSQDDIPVFRCLSHGRDIHHRLSSVSCVNLLRDEARKATRLFGALRSRRTTTNAPSVVHGRRFKRMRRRRVGS